MVAGGAALLVDMGQTLGYNTDPKVIKSVLLNSADKLAGWSHTPTQPLDYNQGAGQMDLQQALAQYSPGESDPGTVPGTGWDLYDANATLENMYALDAIVPAGETITVTLAWNRIVTTNTEDIEAVIYTLDHLDNLDLFVYAEDNLTTPLASSVSTVDNVEHIVFTVPTTGRYVLGVDITGGGAGHIEPCLGRIAPGRHKRRWSVYARRCERLHACPNQSASLRRHLFAPRCRSPRRHRRQRPSRLWRSGTVPGTLCFLFGRRGTRAIGLGAHPARILRILRLPSQQVGQNKLRAVPASGVAPTFVRTSHG